jgi:hypothetical protein
MAAMERCRRALLRSTLERVGWTIGGGVLFCTTTLGTAAVFSGTLGTVCVVCLLLDVLLVATLCSLNPRRIVVSVADVVCLLKLLHNLLGLS